MMKLTEEQTKELLEQLEEGAQGLKIGALNIVGALFLLLCGWFIAKWLGKKTAGRILATTRQEIPASVVGKIVRVGICFVFFITAAAVIGIPITATLGVSLVLLAAFSVAVALSLKDDLSLVAAGVMLLLTKPFKLGDFIEIPSEGIKGYVTEIGLVQTHIAPKNRKETVIPNDIVAKNTIVNYNSLGAVRLEVTYTITYSADWQKAIAIIKDAIKDDPMVEHYREPEIVVGELSSNSVDILCKIFVLWKNHDDLLYKLNALVKQRFDAEGIEFAFPQVDVHMK